MPPSWRVIAPALAGSICRHRLAWLGGSLLVVLMLGLLGATLSVRLDFTDFLVGASSGRVPAALHPRDRLIVVIEMDQPLEGADLSRVVTDLAAKLESVSGVARVRTGLSAAEQNFIEDFLPANLLLYVDPDSLRVVAERLQPEVIRRALGGVRTGPDAPAGAQATGRERRDPLLLAGLAAGQLHRWAPGSRIRLREGLYALPDGRTVFLEVDTSEPRRDIEATRLIVRGIEAVLAEVGSEPSLSPLLDGARMYTVGYSVSVESVFTAIFQDIVRVATAASIIVVLLVWIFFRRFTAPIVLLATVGVGVLAAAGGAAALFGSVSLVTWIFAVLLLGLGVDFGIHLAVPYWIYGKPGASRSDSLARAIRRSGQGVLVAGLTTAGAFASVALIPSPVTREVAVVSSLGLLAIMVSSFTVLPLLLSFSAPAARSQGAWNRWTRIWERTHRLPPIMSAGPWVVVAVGGIAAALTLPIDYDAWLSIVRSDPNSSALERLIEDMGIAFPPVVVLSRAASTEQALARDREAVRRVLDMGLQGNVAAVESLSRWLPSDTDQRANLAFIRANRDVFSAEKFRDEFVNSLVDRAVDPYLTTEYMPRIARAMNPRSEPLTLANLRDLGMGGTVDRHLAVIGDSAVVASFVYLRRLPWAAGVADRFVRQASAAGLYDLPGVTLRDASLRPGEHARTIRRAAALATLVAIILVGSILTARFRRLSVILLCLVPLACAVSVAALVMRILGMELSLISITIAPILVGISVDDGIHMVDRLSDGQELNTVLGETGSSMTMTTLTTVGAFACLGLAATPGIRELGVVGAAGLVAALAASLQLIPLGWRWIEGRSQPGA